MLSIYSLTSVKNFSSDSHLKFSLLIIPASILLARPPVVIFALPHITFAEFVPLPTITLAWKMDSILAVSNTNTLTFIFIKHFKAWYVDTLFLIPIINEISAFDFLMLGIRLHIARSLTNAVNIQMDV